MYNQHESNVIRTFWHGSDLSVYEELSLSSFVRLGHQVQVFSYHPLRAIAGVERLDAATILPEAEVFTYQTGPGKGSFAAFSNWFRYKMLHQLGGTWIDADVLCLKPFFTLPSPCVGWQDSSLCNSAVMRFPPGHPLTKQMYDRARELGQDVVWGQTGPRLLTEIVLDNRDQVSILPRQAFYPIAWRDAWRTLSSREARRCERAGATSYCVHWWNEMMRRIGVGRDKLPPEGSYIHRNACVVLGRQAWKTWQEEELDARVADYLRSRPPPPPSPSVISRLGSRLRKAAASLSGFIHT